MKEIKIKYENTGDIRCPKEGEWFRNPRGVPEKAMFDFSSIKLPIVKQVIIEEEIRDELLEP